MRTWLLSSHGCHSPKTTQLQCSLRLWPLLHESLCNPYLSYLYAPTNSDKLSADYSVRAWCSAYTLSTISSKVSAMAYEFFLSYTRSNYDRFMQEFFEDLSTEVGVRRKTRSTIPLDSSMKRDSKGVMIGKHGSCRLCSTAKC